MAAAAAEAELGAAVGAVEAEAAAAAVALQHALDTALHTAEGLQRGKRRAERASEEAMAARKAADDDASAQVGACRRSITSPERACPLPSAAVWAGDLLPERPSLLGASRREGTGRRRSGGRQALALVSGRQWMIVDGIGRLRKAVEGSGRQRKAAEGSGRHSMAVDGWTCYGFLHTPMLSIRPLALSPSARSQLEKALETALETAARLQLDKEALAEEAEQARNTLPILSL